MSNVARTSTGLGVGRGVVVVGKGVGKRVGRGVGRGVGKGVVGRGVGGGVGEHNEKGGPPSRFSPNRSP